MPSISKICPLPVQKAPNPSKFLPKPLQNRPQSFPKWLKIHSKGLLELILDQCFTKIWFGISKKRPKWAQKCPKESPECPKPLPNGVPDPPKSTSEAILGFFFCHSKFALIFYRFFADFLWFFKSSTLTKHCKNQGFFNVFTKSAFSRKIQQIFEKSSQNPPKTLPKLIQNRLNSLKNR